MPETILLVDDLPLMLEIEAEFFKDTSMTIVTAKNGLDALTVIKNQKVDVVFMDLEMPVMDGATCCKVIKSDPHYRSLPVVIVTSSIGRKDDCIASGCDYFLTKPARRQDFLEISGKYIAKINRREKRIPCKRPLILSCKATSLHCSLADISAGGAYVVTDYKARINELVEVSFDLPNGSSIKGVGKVVWVNDGDPLRPRGIGVKFLMLTRIAQAQLEEYIASSSARSA